MSIVRMTSETCYHPSIVENRYDAKGNYNVPPCKMTYSAEQKVVDGLLRLSGTLTCPTCGEVEDNVVKVVDYMGHEEGRISHCDTCPHHNTHDLSGALSAECITNEQGRAKGDYKYCMGPYGALWMKTTHVGVVLEDRERNGYSDSDFYAVVWNHEKQCTEHVEYATTRGWTYPNHCKVDATPEVLAAYRAWSEKKRAEYRQLEADREAKRVARGKTLRVVKGRKVAKGTVGLCFWHGAGNYGMRVGIKDSAGTVHWTAETNCEVVLPATDSD
jgi:hypothetical protein